MLICLLGLSSMAFFGPVLAVSENVLVTEMTQTDDSPFSVSATALTLNQYDSAFFAVTLNSDQYTLDQISIQFSDASIASVNLQSRQIQGLSAGTTTLTLALNEFTVAVTITVLPIKASISFQESKFYLIRGLTYQVPYTITPDELSARPITWASSNPKVATVENGKITGLHLGKTNITATVDGQTATLELTVTAPLESIAFSQSELTITLNEKSSPLSVILTPTDTTTQVDLEYQVTNPDIVQLNDDLSVTALKAGSTTIRASYGDYSASINIIVKPIQDDDGNIVLELNEKIISGAQVEYSSASSSYQANKSYGISLPSDTLKGMLATQNTVAVSIMLDPALYNNSFSALDYISLSKDVLGFVQDKKLIVMLKTSYGTTLITYTFVNPYSQDLNLAYSLTAFKESSALGNIAKTSGYQLQFTENQEFPLDTTVTIPAGSIEAKQAEARYFYQYIASDANLLFDDQISTVDDLLSITFTIKHDDYVITNVKIRDDRFNTLYLVLTGLIIMVVGLALYTYLNDKKKSSNTSEL